MDRNRQANSVSNLHVVLLSSFGQAILTRLAVHYPAPITLRALNDFYPELGGWTHAVVLAAIFAQCSVGAERADFFLYLRHVGSGYG